MQLADAAEAIAIDAGLQDYFIYYERMERGDVPEDVTHVRIDLSVRRIKDEAFLSRTQLRIVILNDELEEIGEVAFGYCESMEVIVIPDNVRAIQWGAFYYCTGLRRVTLGDGLEEIGEEAFSWCTSMEEIVIPNAVRAIKKKAFNVCVGLTRVTLGDGLEEIGEGAFESCESMEEIVIPNAVRAIKKKAFNSCTGLRRVTLGDGLEEIGWGAFRNCTMMEEIAIPPAVRDLHDTAFDKCTNLTRVKFCDEIEEFVSSDAMRNWWNQGRHEKSLRTYRFIVRCDIPARCSGLTPVKSWQATINDMLRSIPTVYAADSNSNDEDADEDTDEDEDEDDYEEDLEDKYKILNEYFDAIDARLTVYENMREAPKLLGLVIQSDDIVERVLSFF
jgi:hypothetical protein